MFKYSIAGKAMHQLVLGSKIVSETLFDLENAYGPKEFDRMDATYVTGLARAGTTVLMNAIHDSGEFASLTYKDMPFVLAPNLWAKFSAQNHTYDMRSERAHGDGISISLASPEAFEEVFWRMQCGDQYIGSGSLMLHDVNEDAIVNLIRYQNLVCARYRKKRYLAKNNNHLLRLRSLTKGLGDTIFLIVFRNPISQASSLKTQHLRFLNIDRFGQNYLTWLAHHEFGITHRPISINNRFASEQDKSLIDYWLERWIDAYSLVLAQVDNAQHSCVLVCYEDLCDGQNTWHSLCDLLKISRSPSLFATDSTKKITDDYSKRLVAEAMSIYDELRHASLIWRRRLY